MTGGQVTTVDHFCAGRTLTPHTSGMVVSRSLYPRGSHIPGSESIAVSGSGLTEI